MYKLLKSICKRLQFNDSFASVFAYDLCKLWNCLWWQHECLLVH